MIFIINISYNHQFYCLYTSVYQWFPKWGSGPCRGHRVVAGCSRSNSLIFFIYFFLLIPHSKKNQKKFLVLIKLFCVFFHNISMTCQSAVKPSDYTGSSVMTPRVPSINTTDLIVTMYLGRCPLPKLGKLSPSLGYMMVIFPMWLQSLDSPLL